MADELTKLASKEGEEKIEGLTKIVFERTITPPAPAPVNSTITVLEACRDCANSINYIIAKENELTEQQTLLDAIWTKLTIAQKAEYQKEYDNAMRRKAK
jgi:hypothetical protein